nr:hypothetical protein [Tanacetum cinerariifolium]
MSNTLHNVIMEAGGKDHPPMLVPGNYVKWKSRIKRYIDTKPNHELIHYCLKNPPYKFTWADKEVPISKGSSVTTTKTYMENYKNVSQDIRDQLNAEAEAIQIILTGIDNDIYSIVDACPNACEMWKAIERNQCDVTNHQVNVQFLLQLQPEWQRFVTLVKQSQELKTVSYHKLYDILKQHQNKVNEIRAERIAHDETLKYKEIDKLMALISLSFKKIYKPTNNNLQTSSNTSRANQDNSPRINKGTGYESQRIGHVARARETVEQTDWRDDTDDESKDQELEAHYMYMAQIQEVNPDAATDSRPIFDAEPLQKIDHNDDDNDLANERELLAFLIEKLKCKIDDSKNHNKFLETSNKVLVEKLKGEIEDFKNKNKSLESSNNHFKDANNKLSETNALMYKDLKKFQAELDKRNDVENEKKVVCTSKTISILSQAKEAQIKLYKTREDKELDKVIALENKVKFLNEIDRLLREYYYTDHMNAILGVYTELDEVTNLQCDYLEVLEKCECLENELSKSKMMSKSFEALQKHVINLEIDLQQCQEKIKNEKSFKENQSKEFHIEREQYFEIQDLKAQLQDKAIAISEVKKLIEKLKGKSVDTKFEKSSVIRQSNAFKSQRPSILGNLTIFSDSLERKDFSKSNLNAKSLNVNFVCATCGKCVLNEKHDMYVLTSLDGVNSRTKMPIVVPVSTREPKRTVKQSVAKPLRKIVASETTNQKPRNITRKLYERVRKACSWWYPKFTPPGYKWKPKSEIGNVNQNVSMPLGTASRTANILEPMTSRHSTVLNTPLSSSRLTLDQTSNPTLATNTTPKGYAEAIVVPLILAEQFELKHSLINMMTTDQFFRLEKENPHDHIRCQSTNECCDYRHDGYAQTISSNAPPALVKAVEEMCVTCGSAHPYYQCLVAGGNTFPEFKDNIQGYVSAVVVNCNQGFNGGNNSSHEQSYQATTQQNQNFHLNEMEKIKRMNEANMKAMQTQIDMAKNELRTEMKSSIQTSLSNQTNEIKYMMASLLQMNTASISVSGSLPSNTVANPKGELKAITTRSGLVTDGPTVPTPPKSITPEVDERVEETYTDPDLAEYTIKVPPPPIKKYKPPSQKEFVFHKRNPLHPNIPYPSRMLKQKQQEKDEGCNVLSEKLPDLNYTKDLHPTLDDNLLSGSTTYSSNSFLEEFTDELALITYPPEYEDNLHLKDSIDQKGLANLDAIFVDPIPEMFTNEHTLDYSSPPKFDVYDDDFLEVESDAENVYDDPFDSKGEKIKEVDALPSNNNEDKVFNPGIINQEKLVKIITRVVQDKKLAISNASLVLEDFDPPFYEPLFFKEVPKAKMLLPFSYENEEKNYRKDGKNLDKMKEKGDACIFVGYSTQSRAYMVFNKRTRMIVETIHVNFDELPQMASDHVNSDLGPQCQRTALEHDSLSPGPQCQENGTQPDEIVTTSNELDLLFSLMFDELLNGSTQVVSKSFAVTTADAPNPRQQQKTTPLNTQTTPAPTCQVPTQAPTVTST